VSVMGISWEMLAEVRHKPLVVVRRSARSPARKPR
jgi:hypothetical protein